jgi:hypothetical protein
MNLRNQISENELDLFLMNNVFRDKEYIEKNDFVEEFDSAIKQARYEQMNQEAINDFERDHGQGRTQNFEQTAFGRTQMNASATGLPMTQNLAEMTQAYNQNESLRILSDCLTKGQIERVREEIGKRQTVGKIRSQELKATLRDIGQVPEMEALRFTQQLA